MLKDAGKGDGRGSYEANNDCWGSPSLGALRSLGAIWALRALGALRSLRFFQGGEIKKPPGGGHRRRG